MHSARLKSVQKPVVSSANQQTSTAFLWWFKSKHISRPSKYLYLEKSIHIMYLYIYIHILHRHIYIYIVYVYSTHDSFGTFAKVVLTSRISVQYSTSPAKLLTHRGSLPPSAWVCLRIGSCNCPKWILKSDFVHDSHSIWQYMVYSL